MKRTTFLKSLGALAVLPFMSFKDIFKSKEDEAREALNQIELIGLKPIWRMGERHFVPIKWPSGYDMSWQLSDDCGKIFLDSCPFLESGRIPTHYPTSYKLTIALYKNNQKYERTWPRAITVLPSKFYDMDIWSKLK